MKPQLILITLALATIVGATQTPQKPGWDLTLAPNKQVDSTLTVVNQCQKTHSFRVTTEDAPFARLGSEPEIKVSGRKSEVMPIVFNTSGLAAGSYQGRVVVTCSDCQTEPTCTQDREVLQIKLAVADSAATIPSSSPAPTTQQGQTPIPQPTASGTTQPTSGTSSASQTQSGARPKPSPMPAGKGLQTGVARRNQGQPASASFSKDENPCCKEIRKQNGGILRFMNGQNGFELAGDKLILTIDGQRFEWPIKMDDPDLNGKTPEYILCHIRDSRVISQLTQRMSQAVSGGAVKEAGNTVNVSFAGPHPDETTTRPFKGFQFTAQNIASGVKEYGVSFSMDEKYCAWSMQVFADDKTRWFATRPPRQPVQIRRDLSDMGTKPPESRLSAGMMVYTRAAQPYEQGSWWGHMYRYIGEIQQWYAWIEEDPTARDAERRQMVVDSPFRSWQVAMRQSLIDMRNTYGEKLTASDKKLMDEMQELLKDRAEEPNAAFIEQVLLKYNQLWERFRTGVPPK